MKRQLITLVLLAVLHGYDVTAQHHHESSPYAADTNRAIKALAPEDVDGYLDGQGMGLARAAELNGYPGPLHVLELEVPLGLTTEQREAAASLRAAVLEEARRLGQEIVDAERALDHLFAGRAADEAGIAALTARIGDLQGTLRAVHLQAHVRMKAHLTDAQVARYNALRGYTGDPAEHQGH